MCTHLCHSQKTENNFGSQFSLSAMWELKSGPASRSKVSLPTISEIALYTPLSFVPCIYVERHAKQSTEDYKIKMLISSEKC